ncbi:hypothetical protein ACJMK2_000036, partial [Sinanodonta woodiana]
SFDDYCLRMARDGEWADHVVVVAMARIVIVWVVGQTKFQGDPILLGHVWESHYMSLHPI